LQDSRRAVSKLHHLQAHHVRLFWSDISSSFAHASQLDSKHWAWCNKLWVGLDPDVKLLIERLAKFSEHKAYVHLMPKPDHVPSANSSRTSAPSSSSKKASSYSKDTHSARVESAKSASAAVKSHGGPAASSDQVKSAASASARTAIQKAKERRGRSLSPKSKAAVEDAALSAADSAHRGESYRV
jgi:hypothetical protein